MGTDILIKVDGVSKKFCRDLKKSLWYGMKDLGYELFTKANAKVELRPDEFWAVNDVKFELRRGECLGLIGHNGAGKTTLLKILNGLIKPDKGRIELHGKISALLSLGAGFHPLLTGRENIYINGSILGLTKHEISTKVDEIIDFSEIGEFIDMPVQSYSSGMHVRLGFSIASCIKPDILLLDEILAVGDANFRSKCWFRLGKLLTSSAVILVSHESYAISRLCDRALLLKNGKMQSKGDVNKVLQDYMKIPDTHKPNPKLSLHQLVRNFSIIATTHNINYGDYFKFKINITVDQDVSIDHTMINILDATGDIHAQSLVDFHTPIITKGNHQISFEIGPLHLSHGKYSLVILISRDNGKQPIVHSINELGFNLNGHPNYGPKYYPLGTVTQIKSFS